MHCQWAEVVKDPEEVKVEPEELERMPAVDYPMQADRLHLNSHLNRRTPRATRRHIKG